MNKILVFVLIALLIVTVFELGVCYHLFSFPSKGQPAPAAIGTSQSSSFGPSPVQYNYDMKNKRPETLRFSETLKKLNLFALSNDRTMADSQISVQFDGTIKSISSASGTITIHLEGEEGNPDYSALKFDQQYVNVHEKNGNRIEPAGLKTGDRVEISATYSYKTSVYGVKITKIP